MLISIVSDSNDSDLADKELSAKSIFTVYRHVHIESGRCYVGQTRKTMLQRWNQHVYTATRRSSGWSHFSNAIRKYGKDAFSHEILEQCTSLRSANIAKKRWIEHFDSRNPEKGFNFKEGGDHTPHPVTNPWDRPEFREKCSKNIHHCHTKAARAAQQASLNRELLASKVKEVMNRPEVKTARRELYDSAEYKAKHSEKSKAWQSTPEGKRIRSDAAKSVWQQSEYQDKVKEGIRKAHARPEVREKMSAAAQEVNARPEVLAARKAYRASEETKAKIGAKSLGRNHTPESVMEQRRLYLERSSQCKFCSSVIEGKRTCIKGRVACHGCYQLHKNELASFLRPDKSFV